MSPVTSGENDGRTPRRVGFGPQSKLVLYASWVEQWLREDPNLSGADILRRARFAGYRGGKSALYELVRRLRALA